MEILCQGFIWNWEQLKTESRATVARGTLAFKRDKTNLSDESSVTAHRTPAPP